MRIRSKILLWLVTLVDTAQAKVLKNYAVFAFLVSHAPQKLGAETCWYRAYKEFLIARKRVPAYRDFLQNNKWKPLGDDPHEVFRSLPIMDKQNYILPYPTEERCLGGRFLEEGVVIDESSGSTGIPYNWVRSQKEREIVKTLIGLYLRYCFGRKKFIFLNMFSMGAWATGFNMALAGQALGVVKSTGPDVDKVLRTMRFFGSKYPYILNGYPPFLKYLFDEGEKRGFDWHGYEVHVLVGGEGMTEGLRRYLLKYAHTVYSGYGASDLEIGMAGENPLTVMIRDLCSKDVSLRKALFGDDPRLPMLFQYNPLDHLVEILNGEIVVTISKPWTLAPKIRYNIKDEGGMITFDEMKEKLHQCGIDLLELERTCRFPRWYLPFLYVYGRKDATVSIMGANIYPEDVENVVYSDTLCAKAVNSFCLSLEEDAQGNPKPCFEFELVDISQKAEVEKRLTAILGDELAKINVDYKKARDEYAEAVRPVIRTWALYEGPFKDNQARIKKRYVKQ